MEIAKIAKLTKIHCGNLNPGIEITSLDILKSLAVKIIEVEVKAVIS